MKRRDNLSEEAILSLLKTHGRCSARDVAQALGSTRMAAFLMMTAMERYGKLEYDPRLGYAIAPKSATVLTMALAPGRVEARLYDLGGRQLKAATQAVEDGSYLDAMERLTRQVGSAHAPAVLQLGAAGQVWDGRLVRMPGAPELDGVDLAAELGRRTGLRVAVCNDANAMAQGFYESHVEAQAGGSMAYLYISPWGVGLGTMVDGRPLVGNGGFAGEVEAIGGAPADRLKKQITATMAVLAPGFMVIAAGEGVELAAGELQNIIAGVLPGCRAPRLHFAGRVPAPGGKTEPEYQADYAAGLAAMAIERALGRNDGAGGLGGYRAAG